MLLYLIISLITQLFSIIPSVITLTPLIPLSLKGEGEEIKKRGYRPS